MSLQSFRNGSAPAKRTGRVAMTVALAQASHRAPSPGLRRLTQQQQQQQQKSGPSLAAPAILQHDFSPGTLGGKRGAGGVLCLEPVVAPAVAATAATPPAVLSRAAAAATEDTSREGWHRDGSFRVPIDPRPSEIDEFGVVNNLKYNEFMYTARYRLFQELGEPVGKWQLRGVNGVTVKTCTSYKQPLRLGDGSYATCGVKSVSRAAAVLEEKVRRRDDDSLVAVSEVTIAYVDDDFRPVRLPLELKASLERGAAASAAAAAAAAAA